MPPTDLPFVTGVLAELPEVAGEEQFELGLTALTTGLTFTHVN
ncbi:hypothetical protein [Pseudarthrobacter sp. fls2-241-R2A-127]|nr:hypothetical protein [Pseudarthrobacter sp. fls2-241-R2A-127]